MPVSQGFGPLSERPHVGPTRSLGIHGSQTGPQLFDTRCQGIYRLIQMMAACGDSRRAFEGLLCTTCQLVRTHSKLMNTSVQAINAALRTRCV